jgi:hypothetical protein
MSLLFRKLYVVSMTSLSAMKLQLVMAPRAGFSGHLHCCAHAQPTFGSRSQLDTDAGVSGSLSKRRSSGGGPHRLPAHRALQSRDLFLAGRRYL